MKAEIVSREEFDYPKLRFSKTNNGLLVVLFQSVGKGMVVYDDDKSSFCYQIGHYSKIWQDSDFKDFNGEINLRNY